MQEENNYCVYKHTSPSGKVYIGITSLKPEIRWKNGYGYHHNSHFTNAINRYGWENFTHEILFTNLSKEEACQKEIELIAFYKSNQREFGYNNSHGGETNKGCKWSEESKVKLSNAFMGEKNNRYGAHHSEETKRKISEANKGRKHTEDSKRKMSESKQNVSEETKRKISESNKGKCISEETRRKISKSLIGRPTWNKGTKMSEDFRRKISEHSATPKVAEAYKDYKANGGTLKWNEFQKEYSKQIS